MLRDMLRVTLGLNHHLLGVRMEAVSLEEVLVGRHGSSIKAQGFAFAVPKECPKSCRSHWYLWCRSRTLV